MSQADFTWQFSATVDSSSEPGIAQIGDLIEMQFSLPEDAPNTHTSPDVVYFSYDIYAVEVRVNGSIVGSGSFTENFLRVASEPNIGADVAQWSAAIPGGLSIGVFFSLPTFVIPFNPGPSDTFNANLINFANFSRLYICLPIGVGGCVNAAPIQTYQFEALPPSDFDADGVPDATDNCVELANTAQRDTDGDGFGNLCDADLNNDCAVNFLDLAILGNLFLTTDEHADLNGDGTVNFIDVSLFVPFFGLAPGPSGVASCP